MYKLNKIKKIQLIHCIIFLNNWTFCIYFFKTIIYLFKIIFFSLICGPVSRAQRPPGSSTLTASSSSYSGIFRSIPMSSIPTHAVVTTISRILSARRPALTRASISSRIIFALVFIVFRTWTPISCRLTCATDWIPNN